MIFPHFLGGLKTADFNRTARQVSQSDRVTIKNDLLHHRLIFTIQLTTLEHVWLKKLLEYKDTT